MIRKSTIAGTLLFGSILAGTLPAGAETVSADSKSVVPVPVTSCPWSGSNVGSVTGGCGYINYSYSRQQFEGAVVIYSGDTSGGCIRALSSSQSTARGGNQRGSTCKMGTVVLFTNRGSYEQYGVIEKNGKRSSVFTVRKIS